ncbi:bifunctional 2-C-methyl-D-erythritol 4-phosphate cytidylyltransferase/2-C-methyl-D-erythritol 2,4-cyclodiphosphate synthase [Anderseniella sp. Alg231-50]|uniref:bifunctional 2-C-methyl-D-erythritol 4-phosphate cytidylyltransferase/2-C-methyl-D-erythritol 2,4-cyclodiphosphate synthase n=1 Tax=Anderseniella sp. Alg231-50 TaxID=1922226 RepID=UPI000D5515E8
MTTAVIIVAAGAGLRVGGEVPKQYQQIGGQAVLRHTVRAFQRHEGIDHIQVVIGDNHDELYRAAVSDMNLPEPVQGGTTRQASVYNGLQAIAALKPTKVLIHDAARPFVDTEIISSVIDELSRSPGCIPAVAVADTLKRTNDGIIVETVDRSGLWGAQTPQAFRFSDILKAHVSAAASERADFTDDASIAEWAGLDVAIIPGRPENTKITTSADLQQAEKRLNTRTSEMLNDVRVGHGYDVHAFEDGDHVVLCGLKIPHTRKLKGHSDADVGLHTLTDAILGALCEGDIGKHFPPTDEKWKGAASDIFLKHAAKLVADRGGMISHVDLTLICQAPKMRPHVDAMRVNVAQIIGIAVDRVSVKATTTEWLGFTGREEGIAAAATATVRLPE